ncbi:KedN5 family methylcobalamin-dependent radical SAM C-methyltransferase [Amycolatopsis decaplanina]|uniref:Radical SAM domain-containing protein n=1 Tax=Amycolatopsis decaplanina DSM 44594 TaxID=1284240 RepID=M2Z226_9PSEU|nr:KedN5 family methylcobalamin-dependent radical SAM C-methyltransferase [Amycolatopsis decaplanina]EME54958.1 radical SAM domain-containing protein [Amycolatopsis decaplanina DSM 44594]
MDASGKLSVVLVQQGVWDSELESMPLASGYLKASALADERLNRETAVSIRNYRGRVTTSGMANDLFGDAVPDVLAFSVCGWNFRQFGALAETFKQLNPQGWVIFGGTHVAHQGERTFRMFPAVDVVVDGEGEFVFPELLHAVLDRRRPDDLDDLAGLTYRDRQGSVISTDARPRITNLDDVPSPFLTGAIELTDGNGRFRYDVALMETNRGCPYKCAFCYWGGATGQKVRAFSRERLRAELEVFAKLEVHTIVLCDANFGMLPGDEQFVEDVIELRERYGFPRAIEASWAKNKSKTFFRIVRRMKETGMRSSFTLALQTLDDDALDLMNRRNMKVNDWEELVAWLAAEGLDCYAELIWGAPGETIESFMAGYDRLSAKVSRIACYPMLLLPNTDYTEKKELHGLVTVRGDNDDFEYVLANRSVSFAQNQKMARFLYWARVVAEMCVLRHTWVGLRGLTSITQSEALLDFDEWLLTTDNPAAEPLRVAARPTIGGAGDLETAITLFYTDKATKQLLRAWWTESILPRVPDGHRSLLQAIFDFDLLTQPVTADSDDPRPQRVSVRCGEYYVLKDVKLRYDIPGILGTLRRGETPSLSPDPTVVDLYYRVGADDVVRSTNHETIIHFMGQTTEEVMANAGVTSSDFTLNAEEVA